MVLTKTGTDVLYSRQARYSIASAISGVKKNMNAGNMSLNAKNMSGIGGKQEQEKNKKNRSEMESISRKGAYYWH